MQFRDTVSGSEPFKIQFLVDALDGVTPLNPDDVTSWELRIFHGPYAVKTLTGQSPTGTNGKLYAALQTGGGWDRPGGFNFDYTVASDLWRREGGWLYRFEFKFITNSTLTGPVPVNGEVYVEPTARGAR